MKLVRESLFENENYDNNTVRILSYLLKSDYETFTRYLSKTMSNDNLFPKLKSLIENGKNDNDPEDEKFEISEPFDFPVKKLIPTQNEIDLHASLSFSIEFPNKQLEYNIDEEKSKKDIQRSLLGEAYSINNIPILIYEFENKTYICDGHHRWSFAYTLNPDTKMKVIRLKSNRKLDPVRVLKAIQLSIAVNIKSDNKLPFNSVKSKENNILNSSNNSHIISYLEQNLSDEFVDIYNKTLHENLRKKDIIKIIYKNVLSLQKIHPIRNAPNRSVMPQIDGSKEFIENPNAWKAPLKSGKINFIPHYTKNDKLYIK